MTALDACHEARAAWERQDQQQQLDLHPSVLNAAAVQGQPHGLPPGRCVEHGADGSASALRTGHGGTVLGASTPCSQDQTREA